MGNAYCESLGIQVPVLEQLVGKRLVTGQRPTVFGLLVVALLERGTPMTLEEVADRLAAAGVAPAEEALRSLKRCRPARPPVYRDGDRYGLDLHDDELDMLTFLFGLRPPRGKAPPRQPAPPRPLADEPLAIAELDQAWREVSLLGWSQQRVAAAILDAHGRAMEPAEVVAFAEARTGWHGLKVETESFIRRGAMVRVREDGRWESVATPAEVVAVRAAVRDRIDMLRRYQRPDPALFEANRRAAERRRTEHAAELAALRRAIVHAFPVDRPAAAVLVDVATREVTSVAGDELAELDGRLAGYDVLAGIDIRATLRGLGIEPEGRRLADLGPPQKTLTINRRGRTLRITTELLIQGSCGIAHPLGAGDRLHAYVRAGQVTKLRRRLEADARSLFALYQYGRTHGAVRLRWGFIDDMLPAPWVHRDEHVLHHLMRKAHALSVELEVVAGSAPGWDDPWGRAELCRVVPRRDEHDLVLHAEGAFPIDEREVQLARLAATIH